MLRPMREDTAAKGPTVTRLSRNDVFPGPCCFGGSDEGIEVCALWVERGCPGVHPAEKYCASTRAVSDRKPAAHAKDLISKK